MHHFRLMFILFALIANLAPNRGTAVSAPTKNPWWPAQGAIILAGGGLAKDTADVFIDRMIALAGGPDAVIVVIPTASDGLPDRLPVTGPQPARVDDLRQYIESRGARHLVFLHTRDPQVANTDDFVKVLRSANAVFFPGGASRVLDQTYHDTLVDKEVKALLKRGGVLAGDSAGAITLGCVWLDWNPKTEDFGPSSNGLCVVPNVAVTPHVQNVEGDERLNYVFKYISAHPPIIGVNIEGNTALVLNGSSAEVIGKGNVSIFDSATDKTKPSLRLSSGERRDLAK